MDSKKIGGSRIKPETVAFYQVWQRRRKSSYGDGTHFVISWISHAINPPVADTFTFETRRHQQIKISTLLSKKSAYELIGNLVKCRCCKDVPLIRYGKRYGGNDPVYYVSCDCLEFDGESQELSNALRAWKANMEHLDTPSCRSCLESKGIIRKAKTRA